MAEQPIDVEELHDALRLRKQMRGESGVGDRLRDLDRYIDVMTRWGLGTEDDLTIEDAPEDSGHAHVITVRWRNSSDLWRAVKRNINKDGVFLQTTEFPGIDSTAELRVRIRRPEIAFDQPAKVIWVNPHERGGRPMGVGLKFLWRSAEDKKRFRAFVDGDRDASALEELS
ncbi:MAG: PilZ domain-containing protein [Myxococcota bacterium]